MVTKTALSKHTSLHQNNTQKLTWCIPEGTGLNTCVRRDTWETMGKAITFSEQSSDDIKKNEGLITKAK